MDKQKIESWCNTYDLGRYNINDDGSIDVNGDVDLYNLKLRELPFKFNNVFGEFNIEMNYLESLKNCPDSVGNFYCGLNNHLTNLEFSPKIVKGSFGCNDNNLTSLKGSPEKVENDFYCASNKLTSLSDCPKFVGGDFYCDYNEILNLDDFDCEFKGYFFCRNTPLGSLFNKVDYDFIQAFKSFKIIKGRDLNIKRLKYIYSIFKKDFSKINLNLIKYYYNII